MLQKVIQPFIDVIYPRECAGCGTLLLQKEKHLCISCWHNLPTNEELEFTKNRSYKLFEGRIPLIQANSYLLYRDGGLGMEIMKSIKYGGNKGLAQYLGKDFINKWKSTANFIPPDVVVPVPISKKKRRKRKYNQSEEIAKGLCCESGLTMNPQLCERINQYKSQTKLERIHRFENVKSAFKWNEETIGKYYHILLLDDTLTTGATLEALALPLITRGINVSIATLAYVE